MGFQSLHHSHVKKVCVNQDCNLYCMSRQTEDLGEESFGQRGDQAQRSV